MGTTLKPIRHFSLALCLALISLTSSAKVKFDTYTIDADFKITHPIELAKLNGNGQQLIVIGVTDNNEKVMAVYQTTSQPTKILDDAKAGASSNGDSDTERKSKMGEINQPEFGRVHQVIIPNNFLGYDLIKLGDTEHILFETNRELVRFDINSGKFTSFLPIESIYLKPTADFLVNKTFVKDLNSDQLDDIIIANFRGVHLFLQQPDQTFSQQTIPILPKIQMNEDNATYRETTIFNADLTQDSKNDLIVVSDNALSVFSQIDAGKFATEPHDLSLPIEVSALNWWDIREADGQQIDQNKLAHRMIDQIEDINNDGLPDLLVRFSQSEGVLDRQNDYEIYFGSLVDRKLSYPEKPNSMITADGTIGELSIVDLDGDKRSEIMVSSFDIGVSQIIGALLSGSIDQDIYLFKMNEDGIYPEDPTVDKEVEMKFSLSSGKSGQPVVKLADFNGDGLQDLVFSSGDDRLKVYLGTTKKRVFERRSERVRVEVPKEGNHVLTKDVNTDGKDDLIIRYGRQDDKKLSKKVVIMLAK